jgi:hypothetical protein
MEVLCFNLTHFSQFLIQILFICVSVGSAMYDIMIVEVCRPWCNMTSYFPQLIRGGADKSLAL